MGSMITYCRRCGNRRLVQTGDGYNLEICSECVLKHNLVVLKHMMADLDLYRTIDETRLPVKSRDSLTKAMRWTYGQKGLLLIGPSGRGKTRILWQVVMNIVETFPRRIRAYAFDCVSFGHELARAYRRDEGEDWLEDVAKSDLVVFDDLGKEKLTDRVESELFGLIDKRMTSLRPILATTEETTQGALASITSIRAPGMIRRLKEACEVVNV